MTAPRWVLRALGGVPASDLASAVVSRHPHAEHIVDTRDSLNALLHDKFGQKVFILHEERAIRHLFLDCGDEVEFRYRVIALGALVDALDDAFLRGKSAPADPGSINALAAFFATVAPGLDVSAAIQVLRDIRSVSNMFPRHRDNANRAMEACRRLGIGYPIDDHFHAWNTLLEKYADALSIMLAVVKTLS